MVEGVLPVSKMILQGGGDLQGDGAPSKEAMLPLSSSFTLPAFPIHKKSEGKKSFDGVHIVEGEEWSGQIEPPTNGGTVFVPQVDLCSFCHSRVKRIFSPFKEN